MKQVRSLRHILLALLGLLAAMPVGAQREQNVVFLFDCTKSMKGYNGAPDIWEGAKAKLHNDLQRRPEGTRVTVIPFQNAPLETYTFVAPDYDWAALEQRLDRYVENVTNTNLIAPWREAQKLLDPQLKNSIYVITDGEHNMEGDWGAELRSWCGQQDNARAFIVELTENATNPVVTEIAENCPNIHRVAPGVDDVVYSEPAGLLDLELVASPDGQMLMLTTDVITEKQMEVRSLDPNITVEPGATVEANTPLTFRLAPGVDYDSLSEQLPRTFSFEIASSCPGFRMVNPRLPVSVVNDPSPKAWLTGLDPEETDIGTTSWYDKFLWSSAAEPARAAVDLAPRFNKSARQEGAAFRYGVEGKDGFQDFKVRYNGVESPDRTFVVAPTDPTSTLEIEYTPEASEGKHYFTIYPMSVAGTDYDLRGKHSVDWNPLKTFLFWLGVALLLMLILWFAVIQRQMYPRIKKVRTITVNSPYYRTVKVKGAWRVTFTAKPQSQGILSRIFKGKEVNHSNPAWSTPLTFRPTKKGLSTDRGHGVWSINPASSSLQPRNEYTLINNQTKEKIQISLT
ncbi:MAG: VWA domain-containing protein [Bacteroidales bacterium]|nr:VWA domain-containing protein [Bacteroidales bacterium]